ncbi:hypothetical protein F5887DRAFT_1061981 [Amanita rubescens]|nr:hypothetical protein F5887DRAFT_1061981 [Amanita rubescens]
MATFEDESYTRFRKERSQREADLMERLDVLDRRTCEVVWDSGESVRTNSLGVENPTKEIVTHELEGEGVDEGIKRVEEIVDGLKREEGDEEDDGLEDFARDVMIELMRNAVETLKTAENVKVKTDALAEIQRILVQDPRTKDVFRELDGLLVLMSVLSTAPQEESEQQSVLTDVVESTRLVFMILSEAMYKHPRNAEWFRTRVGYEFLSHATLSLVSDSETTSETLGLLLSLALHDFSFSSFFSQIGSHRSDMDSITAIMNDYETSLQRVTIRLPGALLILWNAIASLSTPDASLMRCAMFKLYEKLSHVSHRNHAVLCGLSLVGPVFKRFYLGEGGADSTEEKQLLQKLLKRLLEMGAETVEVRKMFESALTTTTTTVEPVNDGKLDMELLDLLKVGMKSRWMDHFSLEGCSSLAFREEGMRGLPSAGFTFMIWLWISELPKTGPWTLFSAKTEFSTFVELVLNEDGTMSLTSSTPPIHFGKTKMVKCRESKHSYVPSRMFMFNLADTRHTKGIFVDGALCDTFQSPYPKTESIAVPGWYILGDDSSDSSDSSDSDWCISSAYLLSTPLADELLKLTCYLGPRYTGTFQDTSLIKFLTYDSSTALNMYLANLALSSLKPDARSSPSSSSSLSRLSKGGLAVVVAAAAAGSETVLSKAVRDGICVPESQFVFAISARFGVGKGPVGGGGGTGGAGYPGEGMIQSVRAMLPSVGSGGRGNKVGGRDGDDVDDDNEGRGNGGRKARFRVKGDVVLVRAMCLDQALWKIGGPAVALRLIYAANAPHELSRSLGVLLDGIKHSWQNSEDMERLRGYEILVGMLRTKVQLINLTGFETIFEFLGINFRSPEQSTIVNVVAYRSIALDFDLWYKKFNMKQRMAKLGLARRLLFVLQTDWYQKDMTPLVVNALYSICQADFSRDETIKPVVSYLAANLHGDAPQADSPQSIVARMDFNDVRGKAEQVLVAFTSLLLIPKYHSKFTSVLPLTRICLLLLGETPTATIAEQIINLIGISIGLSSSFIRKFELVSGWSALKAVVPASWDAKVHKAAFGVLTGQLAGSVRSGQEETLDGNDDKWCTHIVPTILASLQTGLGPVAERCQLTYDPQDSEHLWTPELTMEALTEELMSLHSTTPAFRQVFASQQTTQLFVSTYKTFVSSISAVPAVNNQLTIRLLEKLNHFGLALALDNAVAGTFKREILDTLESAEMIINPYAGKPNIDRSLAVDNRSMRQRISSARITMQVGERMVTKTMTRMAEWRRSIRESEKKRLRKNLQDLREYRRQVPRLHDWTLTLTSERGLWPQPRPKMWRLDETEGPHRIRKKLEPANDLVQSTRVDMNEASTREIDTPEAGSKTPDHTAEVPPWAESYEITATDIEERQLAEDIVEDKHRRVRHELEPGDVIEAVQTVARIAGVDSSPGLLIIGKTHVYMLDGLVENDEGEVIDAHDAPKRLFFVPGSIVELDGPQRAQRWSHSQIAGFSDKRFLFRDVALEIYFKDSRSLLIVLLDQKRRSEIDHRLTSIIGRHSPEQFMNPSILKSPLFGKMGQIVLSGLKSDELGSATRKWQAREISNFTYLSILNQISGRTPSDATQYPVFPWVLQDYTSQTLDLTSPSTFRDLTKPMGALTQERFEAASMRYTSLQSVNEEPFHYGTHFSSSMIVCHFLIRLAPFTNMFKTLQGGDWDLPDRLFRFLENLANLDFGALSSTGERIHNVKLPPWARCDPLLFVTLNRRALESPQVSEYLPQWIDLIWGYKQRDPESLNVFHPLSYEGSIDLDSIEDDLQREATVGIIHNFGQTPRKLFTAPHPQRYNHGLSTLPIGTLHGIEEDPHHLNQATRCFKDLGPQTPVSDFVLESFGDKLVPCPPTALYIPLQTHEHIEWSKYTADLRLFVDNKLVQVVENVFCNCAAFADSLNLVTGCSDYTVRTWKVIRGQQHQQTRIHLTHIMRTHTDEVICITASRAWSLVGYIATCSVAKLCLHTINARHITTLDLASPPVYATVAAPITSLAFHERDYSHLGVLATGASDGSITLRTWTADGTPEGEKAQWEFLTIRTVKVRNGKGFHRLPAITALKFLGESLVHGEETGKSYVWSLPD